MEIFGAKFEVQISTSNIAEAIEGRFLREWDSIPLKTFKIFYVSIQLL